MWFLGLLGSLAAWAGERVTLPAGEDPALWRVPCSLAGLEPVSSGEAKVHIDSVASGWVLRAVGADGVVRTARVAVPQSPSDREEVAFLARGLLRAIEADAAAAPGPLPVKVTAPPPLPPLPPPPPLPNASIATSAAEPPIKVPSLPAPRTIGPVQIVPEGTSEAPVIELTVEMTVEVTVVQEPPGEPDAPGEPRFDPLPQRFLPEPPASVPDLASSSGAARRQKDRGPRPLLRMPPLGATSGLAWRPGTEIALMFSAGMDVARLGKTELGWDLTFLAPRGLPLEPNTPRQYHALDWQLEALAPLYPWMRVGADGGASFRWYRQQNSPITSGIVPVVGAKTAFSLIPVGNWAVDFIGGVRFDLMETRLVRPDLTVEGLVPVELRAEISFRWWTKGDPFADDPTSKR